MTRVLAALTIALAAALLGATHAAAHALEPGYLSLEPLDRATWRAFFPSLCCSSSRPEGP